MSKILFLGHEGSGKTVLMGVLSRYFETAGDGKWGLNPKNQDAFTFMEFVPAMLAAGKWPAQTTLDGLRCFEWDIEYEGKTYSKIEMVDYPGEAFRALFDQSKLTDILNNLRPDCTILSDLIRTSENIFLVVNPSDILRNEGNIKRTETIWQLCEAVDYLKTLPKKPKLTLVLTQMDRYCDSVETLNAKQILLNANALFAKRGFGSLDIIGVSAVGKTVKNRDGDEVPDIGNSHPMNLFELIVRILAETPFISELETLRGLIVSLKQELNRHCSTPTQCLDLISSLNDIVSKIQPICTKYGYLLGEKIQREYSSLFLQFNEAIPRLAQQEKNLRIQAELERKRKEAEKILLDLKNDIRNVERELAQESPKSLTQCRERISQLTTLNKRIKNTCARHQGIIGADLLKQCDELVEKCNCAVVQLEKKFDNLLDKEVAERKRKEEEKILIDLKRDITNIDVELAKESLQHSTQYGERIRCIKKLSQSVKNTCVRHQGIIGADLLKRCDELVDKCNCAIAQLENEFNKLLAKEVDEAMRARQLKIAQAMNRVEKRLQAINTQKTITYRYLVGWFNCILTDCEFIVQYVSTNTIVNDLIAINNFFVNWQKTNFRGLISENLSKFEKAYPFVKKAKIVLEQERKREMWQRRQMNMWQMIKELILPFYSGLGIALTLAIIINGFVFLVYLTMPSLVEWGAVHAFTATWAFVLGVFSFLVVLSCIKEKLPNWCLLLLWLCGLILIGCIILT